MERGRSAKTTSAFLLRSEHPTSSPPLEAFRAPPAFHAMVEFVQLLGEALRNVP